MIAYLGLFALLALGNGIRLGPDVIAVGFALGLVFAARHWPRTREWISIRDWSPYVIIALAYELIRGLGPMVVAGAHIQDIVNVERILLGGRIATELLQNALRPIIGLDPLAIGSTVLYVLHTPLPVVIGAYLWVRHRPAFYDFLAALFVLSMAAFATYLMFPAAPPWWAAATGHLTSPLGFPIVEHLKPTAFDALVTSVGFDGQALFGLAFNDISPDPVAAFPSLHAAYPLLAFLFVRRVNRRAGVVMFAYTAAAWFAILYLGDHYLVDVIGGAAYALAAYAFLPLWRQLDPMLSSRWSASGSRVS